MLARFLAVLSTVLLLAGCRPIPPPKPTKTPVPTTSTPTTPPVTTTTPVTTTSPPRTGCSAVPSACGYPDATNTGYRRTGVTLSPVAVNSDKVFVISTAGVYDAKDINGCVDVRVSNVTIKRSLLRGCDSYFNIRLYPNVKGFALEDSEVTGAGTVNNAALVADGGAAIAPGEYEVRMTRVDMHDVADGPHPGDTWLIEDSWIHNLMRCSICHNDTIQSAGALTVTVRHNTLENLAGTSGPDGGMNAVVRIATEQGPVQGFTVENNLLVGGNFAVQVRSQGNGAPQGVKILNNRVGRGTTPDGQPYPRFGAWDYPDVTVTLSGNVWDDTGQPVN
jgi:hypothetical protein